MVLLEFQPDDGESRRSLAILYEHIVESSPRPYVESIVGRLISDLFRMPIRFRVGDAELFGSHRNDPRVRDGWRRLPIVSQAISLPLVVAAAWRDGVCFDDPDEYGWDAMSYRRHGNLLIITSELSHSTGQASYDILRNAVLSYSRNVKAYLLNHAPDLVFHPELGSWIRDDVETPW